MAPLTSWLTLWNAPSLLHIEKCPSKSVLLRSKVVVKTKEVFSLFARPGYKCVYRTRSDSANSVSTKIVQRTHRYDSLDKQGLLNHHAMPFKERVLRSEGRGHSYIHCCPVSPAEGRYKSFILTTVIFIYKYNQVFAPATEVQLLNWINEQAHITQRRMVAAFVILSLSALTISTVIGFFTNSFIIAAHGMDRAKGQAINPRELILFTLGLFNIAYQFSMAANDSVLYLWSDVYFSDNVYTVFSILLLFTIFSSFWFTFCLCGFYYVMLVTFEQTFFMRLKQSISDVVPWMLFSSVLLSLVISVPVAWNIQKDEYPLQLDGNYTDNSTAQYSIPHISLQYLLVTSIIGCCIPLILVAVANILIIKSLCVHAKHLGKNTGGMSVQSVEASVSAARTVTSLLILYISFYVSQILTIMAIFDFNSIWFSVCLLVIYAYSPVQSIILILGSPKLKHNFVKSVAFLSCRESGPPNGDIKVIS